MNEFIAKLMEAAKEAGIEAAEAYVVERESFSADTHETEILNYQSNMTRGLGFRGLKNGRMGYASTEAFDDAAIQQLVKGVLESAELCEDTDEEFLYDGKEPTPEIDLYNAALDDVSAADKLKLALDTEAKAKAYGAEVVMGDASIATGKGTVRITNTYGMDRTYTENYCVLYSSPTAKDGEHVSSGAYGVIERDFAKLDAAEVARVAAERAVTWLHASPVPSGKYRIIFSNEVMTSLMGVFCTIFSAKTAQKGMSLLAGRLGETIAAPFVTLIDDPLLPGGLASRPFDAEGVASKAHTVIDAGAFKTFLHNLKTAHKDGVQTTGNASKGGYSGTIGVSPSNLYFKPGTRSLDELMANAGDGIVITDVMGLHAGANAVSGDFSLLSKGYAFHGGKRAEAVEQITVAGNFYELLKNMREFGSDLRFPDGGMGCASVDAGELSVSGS